MDYTINSNLDELVISNIRVHYLNQTIKQLAFPGISAFRLRACRHDLNLFNLIAVEEQRERLIGLNSQQQFILTRDNTLALLLSRRDVIARERSFLWPAEVLKPHRCLLKALGICFIELIQTVEVVKQTIVSNISATNIVPVIPSPAIYRVPPIVTAVQANRLLSAANNACTGNTIFNVDTGLCDLCLNNSYANSTHTACIACPAGSLCGAFGYCYGPTGAANVPCVADPTTGVYFADCVQSGGKCQGQCQGSCGAGELFGYSCTLGTNGFYGCHLTQGWLLAIWIIALILLIAGIIALIIWLTRRGKATTAGGNGGAGSFNLEEEVEEVNGQVTNVNIKESYRSPPPQTTVATPVVIAPTAVPVITGAGATVITGAPTQLQPPPLVIPAATTTITTATTGPVIPIATTQVFPF